MRIVRDFSFKSGRNSTLFVIGIFLLIILTTVFFNTYQEGIPGRTPVDEELFGPYFVITHLALIGVAIVCVIAGILLYRMGIIRHFNYTLIKVEKREFRKQYHFNAGSPVSRSRRNWSVFIMLLSTAFPMLFLMLAKSVLHWTEPATVFALVLGILLMFIVFYGQLRKLMARGDQSVQQFLEKINEMHENTELETEDTLMDYKYGSLIFNSGIKGTYKGYKLHMKTRSSGRQSGRHTTTSSVSALQIISRNKNAFSMKEKNPKWSVIKGEDPDDCFNKRFLLEGITTNDVSDDLKNLALSWKRNINLKVEEEKITYFLLDDPVLPYYTAEGLVLFLDFIIDLVEKAGMMDQ